MDRAAIVMAVKQKIAEKGYTPHERSFVNNTLKMYQLITVVSDKLAVAGYVDERHVRDAMVGATKHLCAAWRGQEDNANVIVKQYINSGVSPDPGQVPQNDHGNEDTGGEGDTPTQGCNGSGNGNGSPDGQCSDSEQVCANQPNGQDGQSEAAGNDTGESSEGEGQGEPQMPQPPQYDEEDMPVSDDYEPPSIWFKCVRIIRWNLTHPGEQKNIMLVGPKGIGKTKMVFELSKKFFQKRPYAVTAPQMEHKICGFNDALGHEVKTPITRGYVDEDGCIVLIDEIDRMDASAGIALNMATANKAMDTPNGMIEQSDKCTFIATANTSGTGATNDYNTANQLDASTRDRWIFLLMEWDHNVAIKVAKGDEALVKGLEDWNDACEQMQYTSGQLSYRTIVDILDLMDMGCFTFEECIQAAMLKYAIPKSNLIGIYEKMKDHYNKVAKAIKKIMDKMPDNDSIF